jgi:hypothetical protein
LYTQRTGQLGCSISSALNGCPRKGFAGRWATIRTPDREAFERLDRAYARREANVAQTNLEPMLKNLHADPRFADFLKKLNLPA